MLSRSLTWAGAVGEKPNQRVLSWSNFQIAATAEDRSVEEATIRGSVSSGQVETTGLHPRTNWTEPTPVGDVGTVAGAVGELSGGGRRVGVGRDSGLGCTGLGETGVRLVDIQTCPLWLDSGIGSPLGSVNVAVCTSRGLHWPWFPTRSKVMFANRELPDTP